MNNIHKLGLLAAVALAVPSVHAQGLKFKADASKAEYITTNVDTVSVAYNAGFNTVAVLRNTADYTVEKRTANADWVSVRKEANGNLTFFTTFNYDNASPRFASFDLTTPNGKRTRTLVVRQ